MGWEVCGGKLGEHELSSVHRPVGENKIKNIFSAHRKNTTVKSVCKALISQEVCLDIFIFIKIR
jgi:hypothetical protein